MKLEPALPGGFFLTADAHQSPGHGIAEAGDMAPIDKEAYPDCLAVVIRIASELVPNTISPITL
jgi:hypothetical protein